MDSILKLFGLDDRVSDDVKKIALYLARYFGVWRMNKMTGDPIRTGHWVVGFMGGVCDLEVSLLHEIADDAITKNDWPPILIIGTESFDQVVKGIGIVCHYVDIGLLPPG